MANGKELTGGCDCGAVKVSISGEPAIALNCHCLNCQHSSGAGHVFIVAFPENQVKATGKTSVYKYRGDSGKSAYDHFCPTCGSHVYGRADIVPGMIAVRAACLDQATDYKPQVSAYSKRLRPWDQLAAGIPSFPAMPPMGG